MCRKTSFAEKFYNVFFSTRDALEGGLHVEALNNSETHKWKLWNLLVANSPIVFVFQYWHLPEKISIHWFSFFSLKFKVHTKFSAKHNVRTHTGFFFLKISHTRFFLKCSDTRNFWFPEKNQCSYTRIFFWKFNVSTPGKFNVHTPERVLISWKNECSHTGFFPSANCFHTSKINVLTHRESSRPRETQNKSMSLTEKFAEDGKI